MRIGAYERAMAREAVEVMQESEFSDAETCCRNGWGPGTRLVGDEGFGPTVIEITAVGEESILAKEISHNGVPSERSENLWTLACRDWRPVSAK